VGCFAKVTGSKKGPPLTTTAVRLFGREVTINDTKARQQLGYAGRVTREEGLSAMTEGRPLAVTLTSNLVVGLGVLRVPP
jgi:hypothetical protein